MHIGTHKSHTTPRERRGARVQGWAMSSLFLQTFNAFQGKCCPPEFLITFLVSLLLTKHESVIGFGFHFL